MTTCRIASFECSLRLETTVYVRHYLQHQRINHSLRPSSTPVSLRHTLPQACCAPSRSPETHQRPGEGFEVPGATSCKPPSRRSRLTLIREKGIAARYCHTRWLNLQALRCAARTMYLTRTAHDRDWIFRRFCDGEQVLCKVPLYVIGQTQVDEAGDLWLATVAPHNQSHRPTGSGQELRVISSLENDE